MIMHSAEAFIQHLMIFIMLKLTHKLMQCRRGRVKVELKKMSPFELSLFSLIQTPLADI